ncbi:MAG TPA: zinc metallopeptidase [Thermoleophilia bacterium]|nr:zinc metallopeptidase [Thermoleophilia bacterium]
MFFDPAYFLYVLIPTLLISGGVQLYLSSTYSHWRKVRNSAGATGEQVGQALFERTSLQPLPLRRTKGELTDNFDPRTNVVNLSRNVASQASVASMAIVAHELGHVQQHQQQSALMGTRNFLVPALTVSPMISYGAIILGLVLQVTGLIWIGIFFFALMVLFSIVTLPVEIDASRRGLRLLREAGLMQTAEDASGARKVLTAAGLTYLAAALTAVLQLLYFVLLAQRS